MTHAVTPTILRSIPLFADISEAEKDNLIQAGKICHYQKGENIFLYGDPIHNFYVICEGAVQLFRETPDGHEMTAEVLIAGDAIGVAEILQSSKNHQFNALAIKDTTLIEFSTVWFKENIKNNRTLSLNVLAMLSSRLSITSIETEHKATMTAAQQVACFLERLCVLYSFNPHGFDLPYSKTLIASRLGMELETFSRALSKLREHGVSIQGNRVSFDNFEELENFVCSNCSIAGNCSEHEQLKKKLHNLKPSSATQA